ncbi:MAG TPA: prenyltransferase/squalene oxidase repeat-containing protein [Pilimelia sp.]|nr:prenyltransferase/squalene oxidase repeat-containing protein [Pilimelia sp.]
MVAYIRTQQQPDGSFPSVGQSSTADAVYALVASGVDPSRVTRNGKSAIDWIYTQTGNLQSTGVAAKLLLALILAGRSTTAPNGFDFVARVRNAYNPDTGLYDPDPTGNAYALIALRAAGQPIPGRALSALAAQQQPDGGWSAYIPPQATDTNTTAVAMIALIVNGRRGPITRALAFLRTQQSPDGGFTFSTAFGTESDANSTGLVILALLAAGQNLATWERRGVDPVERLLQLQNPSGAFRYSDAFPADNAFATFQAGQAAGVTRCRR